MGQLRINGMRCRLMLAIAAAAAVLPTSAHACRMFVRPDLEDVRFADLVVTGRLENYRIIRDEAFRRQMLASPGLSPDQRRIYEDPATGLLPDYARFDIRVEEALVGKASGTLSVTWDNSTFGEPETMEPGIHLIALRRSGSAVPPLRGPAATILPDPDPGALVLLQAPCSSAFIYETTSEEARTIRSIIERQKG